jgi:predicted metal-dependent phosphoesterase TrpH
MTIFQQPLQWRGVVWNSMKSLATRKAEVMLKADLHIHTQYSMDCNTPLEQIIQRCQEKGINCIAIADHGTVEGALKMQDMAPFRVIVAEEVLTPHGEIMGMFLKETIPSGQSVEQAISRIRAQGGLVCIPHPFDRFRKSALDSKMLNQILKNVDIIEILNARIIINSDIVKAQNLASKHGIPGSAGSDAHALHEIGNAYVEMPEFNGSEDFLPMLAKGRIIGHRTNPMSHFSSSLARIKSNFGKKLNIRKNE